MTSSVQIHLANDAGGDFADAQMSLSARPTLFSFYRDHPMATVAATYGKLGDYQNFTRSTLKGLKPYFPDIIHYLVVLALAPPPSNIDSRAKRIAEQENIHQLLQQCRTSQRGAACQVKPTVSLDFRFLVWSCLVRLPPSG
ncbi:hypothetical protein COOONC_02634 [Cooperia oncophora]